jgi:hypothetical protein
MLEFLSLRYTFQLHSCQYCTQGIDVKLVVFEISLIIWPTHKLEEICHVFLNMLTMRRWEKVHVSLAMSVCHFACKNLITAEWISIKFDTGQKL